MINFKTGLGKLCNRCQSGVLGHAKPLRRSRFFGHANFALKKKKKSLDLQIYSQTGKTMKKLYVVNSKYS